MKLFLTSVAALALAGTVATADDFDNTQAFTTVKTGQFEFTFEGNEADGFLSTEIGAEVLNYGINDNVYSTTDVYFRHHKLTNDVTVAAEYTLVYAKDATSVYGAAELEYAFENDNFYLNPTLGTAYIVNPDIEVFAEATYALDATNDFEQRGGAVEFGVDFVVSQQVTLTPSIIRTFDTDDNDTQARIGATFYF